MAKKTKKSAHKPKTTVNTPEVTEIKEEVIEVVEKVVDDSKKATEKAEKKMTKEVLKVEKKIKESKNPFKGFFARKYPEGENILTIFETPRIWGAVIGEVSELCSSRCFCLLLESNNHFISCSVSLRLPWQFLPIQVLILTQPPRSV